jgi:lipid-binding SYLF domain-containing protein
MKKQLLVVLGLVFILGGCSTMSVEERDKKRSDIDAMAEEAIAGLVERDAGIQTELDASVGYAVANMKLTKVPIVGAGGGEGVFVDRETQQRIYFNVTRLDLGGGWGARSFKVLLVFNSEEMVARMEKKSIWEFQAGAEASAGTVSAEGSSSDLNAGFTMHVLSDGGASATVTARVIRIKINTALTE